MQYGFRTARSTLQPIHIVRHTMGYDEAAGDVQLKVNYQIRSRSDIYACDMVNGNLHDTKEHIVISTQQIGTARSHVWAPDILPPTTLWLVAEELQHITCEC